MRKGIPLDSPVGLIGLAVMLVILLLWLASSISEFLLGRYLKNHHPETWLELGCPGKIGRFGREVDYLSGWQKHKTYETITDERLHAKCRSTRRLEKLATTVGVSGIIGMLILLFAMKR